MADAKITALTEETAPISSDIAAMVDDPGGSATTKKVTFDNIAKSSCLGGLMVRMDITGLTGGTATDLDSIATTALTAGTAVVMCYITGQGVSFYALVSGTDAESSPNIIRPDDYAATTNEKVWKWEN